MTEQKTLTGIVTEISTTYNAKPRPWMSIWAKTDKGHYVELEITKEVTDGNPAEQERFKHGYSRQIGTSISYILIPNNKENIDRGEPKQLGFRCY